MFVTCSFFPLAAKGQKNGQYNLRTSTKLGGMMTFTKKLHKQPH